MQAFHDILQYLKIHDVDLIMATIIAIVGVSFSYLLKKALTNIIEKKAKNKTAKFFVVNIVYTFSLAVVLIMVLSKLGLPTNSLIAVLGASSLAIALALKDSLSNVAAGIMLIFEGPFKIGDSIEISGTAGTVISLSLFNTTIKTANNETIYIPNGKLISDKILNKTSNPTRRLLLTLQVIHDTNIQQAQHLIAEVIKENSKALPDPAPSVIVKSLGLSGILLNVRVWTKNADYAALENELLQGILNKFQADKITFSTANMS
jgi:small conductance mechanosensitive channel